MRTFAPAGRRAAAAPARLTQAAAMDDFATTMPALRYTASPLQHRAAGGPVGAAPPVIQRTLAIRSLPVDEQLLGGLSKQQRKTLRHRGADNQRLALLQEMAASKNVYEFDNWRSAATATHLPQVGLPNNEGDSGGIGALVRKFASLKGLGEFVSSVSSTPRVKRHNTSSWITGRVRPQDYSKLYVPISAIRSQHSIDGPAVQNTANRAAAIGAWLGDHPDATALSMETLNQLAGSTGSIKVGWDGGDRFITLDGVGRVEAIRQALANSDGASLRYVQTYAVRLTDDEFSQLDATSRYFRDDQGRQLAQYTHNLVPYTAWPRFALGTGLNLLKNKVLPLRHKLPFVGPEQRPDRRIPADRRFDVEDQ